MDGLPLVAEVDHRGEEPREQQHESGQCAQRDALGAQGPVGTGPQKKGGGCRGEGREEWCVEGVVVGGAVDRGQPGHQSASETVGERVLPAEGPDDVDRGKVFVEFAVEGADGHAGGAFGVADAASQVAGDEDHRGDHQKGDRGQRRAEHHHGDQHGDQLNGLREQGRCAGGEQIIDDLHVRGSATDRVPERDAVVVRRREREQVREQARAEPGQASLGNGRGEVAVDGRQKSDDGAGGEVGQPGERESRGMVREEIRVDDAPDDQRGRELGHRRRHHHYPRAHEPSRPGAGQAAQPRTHRDRRSGSRGELLDDHRLGSDPAVWLRCWA